MINLQIQMKRLHKRLMAHTISHTVLPSSLMEHYADVESTGDADLNEFVNVRMNICVILKVFRLKHDMSILLVLNIFFLFS